MEEEYIKFKLLFLPSLPPLLPHQWAVTFILSASRSLCSSSVHCTLEEPAALFRNFSFFPACYFPQLLPPAPRKPVGFPQRAHSLKADRVRLKSFTHQLSLEALWEKVSVSLQKMNGSVCGARLCRWTWGVCWNESELCELEQGTGTERCVDSHTYTVADVLTYSHPHWLLQIMHFLDSCVCSCCNSF